MKARFHSSLNLVLPRFGYLRPTKGLIACVLLNLYSELNVLIVIRNHRAMTHTI